MTAAQHTTSKLVVQCVTILVALSLIILGITTLISNASLSNPQATMLNFYLCVFGGLLIAAEFSCGCIKYYFNFLESLAGRGCADIFIASLAFNTDIYNLLVFICLLIVGGYNIGAGLCWPDKDPRTTSGKAAMAAGAASGASQKYSSPAGGNGANTGAQGNGTVSGDHGGKI